MPKRPVPPDQKRRIISARVTPAELADLLKIGEGNISRGVDRVITSYNAVGKMLADVHAFIRSSAESRSAAGK